MNEFLIRNLPAQMTHKLSFRHLKPNGQERPFHHGSLAGKYVTLSVFTADLESRASDIDHIYLMGMLQNAALQKYVYKKWKLLVYVDASSRHRFPKLYAQYLKPLLKHFKQVTVVEVSWWTKLSPQFITKLESYTGRTGLQRFDKHGGWYDLAGMCSEIGYKELQFAKTLWRFFPAGEPVAFVSRDADARINLREELASEKWLKSGFTFYRIFDNVAHSNPLLAGLWGAKAECHDVLRDGVTRTSACQHSSVPIAGVIPEIVRFLSEREVVVRGYGIDELFLGTLDRRLMDSYNDDVVTYGQGGFYAGSAVFSPFSDRASLKLGEPLAVLMPTKGPDDVKGTHQSLRNYTEHKGRVIYGEDVGFVGEDIPVRAQVKPEVIRWLIDWTLQPEKASTQSLSASALGRQFSKYRIRHLKPKQLARDWKLPNIEFQNRYHFDKRALPHFWYTFTTGIPENVSFFEPYESFVASEYEVRMLEAGSREAFLKHPKLHKVLFHTYSTENYLGISDKIVNYLVHRRGNLTIRGSNMKPYFEIVHQYVKKHSKIWKHLNEAQRQSYWDTLVLIYPFTAMQTLNLNF